jgi:hypothetical protein
VHLEAKGSSLYRDLAVTVKRAAFLICAVPLITSLAFAGEGQSQPASGNASPTTTSPAKADPNKVILKVGTQQITEAAFEQYVADLEATQGPADLSRKALADNYSSMLMLSQQAVANSLDQSPEVVRQLAIDRMQILSNAEFASLKKAATPTPEQIKAYFEAHGEDYDVVKIRRVFIMANANPQNGGGLTREQAKAMAGQVKQAIASNKDVIALLQAAPHSRTDVVADPDPLSFARGELPEPMDKSAFGLKEGQWTQLADGPDEYVFIQLVKSSRKSLNDVSSQIEKKLQAEKLREELQAVKEKSGIWMDEEYFASKAPVPGSTTQPEASGQAKSGAERGER